ncbi:MetQ/NlpA family ABC transporter substrate-binding protein [Belnapia sp. T6]|uniref:Lipoprotein n=1 Tax=Belnapia mucosa TaxID=2804532 RepID=A0ABS1VC47_9PROT|nr:MetQ/NlpA family ABC transporter substrate-binding protein [Belnapia mucosa]MBL6459200.1 MetQ/NlpA family ABC transporter substrate-binding protein [Belnapia mucosa]
MSLISRRTTLGAALLAPLAAQAQDIGSASRPLRIGVTAGPHAQVMEKVREIAARLDGPGAGLVLHIVEFTDYIQPNVALGSGDLDANSYQHLPFLEQQVRDRRLDLVSAGKTLVFPMGVYSRRHRRVDDIAQGARIAIPNDPTNGGRALMLLASAGAFKLKPAADFRATVADITENPRRLRVVELEAAQLPRALEEVDAAAINTNYAIPAGLNPVTDAIARENADSSYANIIAVRRSDQGASWVRRLLAAYQTNEVKAFVERTFQGAVAPAF